MDKDWPEGNHIRECYQCATFFMAGKFNRYCRECYYSSTHKHAEKPDDRPKAYLHTLTTVDGHTTDIIMGSEQSPFKGLAPGHTTKAEPLYLAQDTNETERAFRKAQEQEGVDHWAMKETGKVLAALAFYEWARERFDNDKG